MISKKFNILIISLAFLVAVSTSLLSCTNHQNTSVEKPITKKQYAPEKNEVGIIVLKKESFKEEIISNGKLKALQKSILKFKVSADLEELPVKEGSYVKKNQILAMLDGYAYEQALLDAKISLKKSELEFQDMLINRGYDINKKDNIPSKITEIAGLRSGYTEAKQQLKKAEHDLRSVSLYAPFSGKIADIQYKKYENVSAGTTFLTLINDSYFEVEFYVTESEISHIKLGETVNILVTGLQKSYKGNIIAINPLVEKNGTIKVSAKIKNDGDLIEGMNASIDIEKEIPEQYVVPKSAIILRQNEEVLFKVVNEKAYWTYVKIIHENKEQYSIMANPEKRSASLKTGDTIIVGGNLNLAHNSEIEIKN